MTPALVALSTACTSSPLEVPNVAPSDMLITSTPSATARSMAATMTSSVTDSAQPNTL